MVTPIFLEPQPQPIASALELLIHLAVHFSAFFAVAFLTSYLSAQLSRTQKALQERTEDVDKLAALNEWILGSIESGLLTVGKNRRVLSWNSAAERILGYSFEEVVGESFERLFPQFAAVSAEEADDILENFPSRHETSVNMKKRESRGPGLFHLSIGESRRHAIRNHRHFPGHYSDQDISVQGKSA